MISSTMIPVIDLEDFPAQSQKLIDACQEWGCFRIVNHKIPATLMPEMKSTVRSLLDLPLEIKRRNADVVNGSGYMAPNTTNPLYEGLGLYNAGSPEAVVNFCSQLGASPHQRDTLLAYSKAIHGLAMDIGKKISESLGLGSDNLFKDWPCQFRINKYSFTPETIGSRGVQIHTDVGFLTILQDDDAIGGLEVLHKKSDTYVPVDHLPGALIVNLGDAATIWSNGRFYNVKHKVECKAAGTRVSTAFFVFGPKEAAMEAPSEQVDSEHPRLYAPIKFEDYKKLWSSSGKAGEALELIRYKS